MALGGSGSFRPTPNPCPTARSHCQRDYRGPSLKEPASPFGNQAEIIKAGPATIPEQFASGLDPGDAGRKYRNTCGGSWNRIMSPVSKHRGGVSLFRCGAINHQGTDELPSCDREQTPGPLPFPFASRLPLFPLLPLRPASRSVVTSSEFVVRFGTFFAFPCILSEYCELCTVLNLRP